MRGFLKQAKLKQLELLENRMKHHILRYWSLPILYISATFLSILKIEDVSSLGLKRDIYSFIGLFGVIVLLAMRGSYTGTTRAIENIKELERDLQLRPTVKVDPMHYVPYLLLVALVIFFAIYKIYR